MNWNYKEIAANNQKVTVKGFCVQNKERIVGEFNTQMAHQHNRKRKPISQTFSKFEENHMWRSLISTELPNPRNNTLIQ